MRPIAIQSINYRDMQITALFNQHWFQEDIVELHQLLLSKIPEYRVKEVTQGADREDIRFQWREAEFILHFDYYSQSCWLSVQDEINVLKIQSLFNLLKKSQSSHV